MDGTSGFEKKWQPKLIKRIFRSYPRQRSTDRKGHGVGAQVEQRLPEDGQRGDDEHEAQVDAGPAGEGGVE